MSEAEYWLGICEGNGHTVRLTESQWCRGLLSEAAISIDYPGVNNRIWGFRDGSSIVDCKEYTVVRTREMT